MADDFELVRLRNGVWGIRSREYGEVCHPGTGPMVEAEALYVRGLDLRRRMQGVDGEFVIWDVGLGGGANAAAVLRAAGTVDVSLRLVSFDRTLGALEFALRNAGALGYPVTFVDAGRGLLEGPRVAWTTGRARVVWERVVGDFSTLVREGSGAVWPPPQAILFDPHSPAVNPEMWTLPLFRSMRERLDQGRPCALATYSRSTAVRVALLLAGFWVGTGEVTASKEETTRAANLPELAGARLGARWLERVRRSSAAEPWTVPPYETRPLGTDTWNRLRAHPQFAGLDG